MKILLAGNIASGKGTFIKGVLPLLDDYDYFSIDAYREKYGDYTEDGEAAARRQFIFDIKWSDRCIIECTGVGVLYTMIKPLLDCKFLLRTSVNTCFERFNKRGTKSVLPSNWFKDTDLMNSLNHIESCHNKTKYNTVFLNNDKKNILRFKSKVNGR